MRLKDEVNQKAWDVVVQAHEFLKNNTPIHPGSELGNEIQILALTYLAVRPEPWTCPACQEPHATTPRECNYCGTKPEAKSK